MSALSRAERKALFELRIDVPAESSDDVSARVAVVTGGVEERETRAGARLVIYGEDRGRLEAQAKELDRFLVDVPHGRVSVVRSRAKATWETDWLNDLEPVRISRTLTLAPGRTGEGLAVSPRSRVVHLEAAAAFGFGDHPTTRMAARLVESACSKKRPRLFLDLGSGTGVLAIIAVLSGAGRAVGVDTDPEAIAIADRNALQNSVGDRCRFLVRPVARVRQKAELVGANLELGILSSCAGAIARAVSARGELLLTGILSTQVRDAERLFLPYGLSKTGTRREGDWALLRFERKLSGARRVK